MYNVQFAMRHTAYSAAKLYIVNCKCKQSKEQKYNTPYNIP